MKQPWIVLFSLCAGCSFFEDFDKFRIVSSDASTSDGQVVGDASTGGAGADSSVSPEACASAAPGTACGRGNDLICLDGMCRTSVCGDGFIDRTRGEECEDGNLHARDGCEPHSCRYSCQRDEDCDNRFVCDGEERCRDHLCVSEAASGLDGASCTRTDQVPGSCKAGYCVPEGCGNGQLDEHEACDGTTGCRPDCTMGCTSDPQCDDHDACNGSERCVLSSGECLAGDPLVCEARDPCTLANTCEPSIGCVVALIDADHDGYAPATCAPGSQQRGGDCDDANPSVHPEATEYCDAIDNDCDGAKDEDAIQATCYPDRDGDGFPLQENPLSACSCPQGTMPARDDQRWDCWDDPNDAGRDVFPGQTMPFATGYHARCASPSDSCTVIKSYDYNCDGLETPTITEGGRTSCGALGGALGCSPSGYKDAPPECGSAAPYLSCDPNGGLLGGCSGTTADRAQLCL